MIEHRADPRRPKERGNVLRAELAPGVPVALGRLERHFYTSSSCGVCGKNQHRGGARQLSCPLPPPAGRQSARIGQRLIHALPRAAAGRPARV